MQDLQLRRSSIALFGGSVMLVMALVGTVTGKLRGRYGYVAHQATDPKQYWWGLAIYYVGAAGFLGWYLYQAGYFKRH